MNKKLEQIASKDGRFSTNAIKFVYEGLGYTMENVTDEPPHITGQTLCEGLRKLALEKWGRLAKLVLNIWGIKTTRDFGEIVYLMIRHKMMSAQPTDTVDDFDDVYDFQQVFKDKFSFENTQR
ncbi:Minf_1886 family protein [Planctomycetota bacterium]